LREKEDSDTSFAEQTGVKFALQQLFRYIRDEDLVKRRGVLCTIKNCLFVKEKHFMIRQTPLLNILLNRFSSTDIETNNPYPDPTINPDDKFHYQELHPYLRRVISECIVMLTATNAGMDQMSTESVYKMLETELKTMTDEETKSSVENVLHRLNKRLKEKNNMSAGGEMVRMEYVDEDEEDQDQEQQDGETTATEQVTEEAVHNDVD
jgi:hypothetical protein